MTKKRASSLTLVYALGVGAFLLFLGFLPTLIRQKRFSVSFPENPNSKIVRSFPLARSFSLVDQGAVKGSSSLQAWFRKPASERGTLLVNFWATWCPPCIEELPSLEMLGRQLRQLKDPSLPLVVTVSVDENADVIQGLFRTLDFKPTFPVLFDPNGAFATTIGTVRFPETYLIGADGTVLYKWVGPQNWVSEEFIQRLRTLIAHK